MFGHFASAQPRRSCFSRKAALTGPVTIQLEFQTRFGTAHSERAATTRRLESGSQTIEIGRFKVGS